MINHGLIRDLAKAAGCDRELSDTEVVNIRHKLAHAYVDGILDSDPQSPKQENPDDGKTQCH